MGLLPSSIVAVVLRNVLQAIITVVSLMFGFVPADWLAGIIGEPPPWLTHPLTRVAIIALGVVAFLVVALWERLFSSPLEKTRIKLVDSAFETLNPEALGWIIQHYAGGRPPAHIGEVLYAHRIVDRDYVGFTEIKDDLKPIIARRVVSLNALWRRGVGAVRKRVTGQAILILLVLTWLFATAALVVFLWQRAKPSAPRSDLAIYRQQTNAASVAPATNDNFYPPTITQEPAPLQAGLYLADIGLALGTIQNDKHCEINIRLFNGTGRTMDLVSVSGQVRFKAGNLITGDPKMSGVLPEPSIAPNTRRSAAPLTEWILILNQRVPSQETTKYH